MVSFNPEFTAINFIINMNLRFSIKILIFTIYQISQRFPKILCQQTQHLFQTWEKNLPVVLMLQFLTYKSNNKQMYIAIFLLFTYLSCFIHMLQKNSLANFQDLVCHTHDKSRQNESPFEAFHSGIHSAAACMPTASKLKTSKVKTKFFSPLQIDEIFMPQLKFFSACNVKEEQLSFRKKLRRKLV